ncbi:MAG: hypothetical protein AAF376_17465 [Pseudomonadota bacterium]
MAHQTKIATCSYCGSRQTLQLAARDGHELACGSCGAPLHEMKWLRPPKDGKPKKRSKPHKAPHGHDIPREDWRGRPAWHEDDYKRRRKKRRKPMWKKALEEAFDVIEDILD